VSAARGIAEQTFEQREPLTFTERREFVRWRELIGMTGFGAPAGLRRRPRQPEDVALAMNGAEGEVNGRDDRIRTCDPLTPSQVRYQAALHPDTWHDAAAIVDRIAVRAPPAPGGDARLPG